MASLAEKILGRAVGRGLRPGEVVEVTAQRIMVHDSIAPAVRRILTANLGHDRPLHPERMAVVIDHVAPAANLATAESQRDLRGWVAANGIRDFHDAGDGIAHQLLIEDRIARPGEIVIGSDSHSTSYGAVCAFGTGMGATDIALAVATGRTWFRVPETIRIEVTGSFGPGVGAKDLALTVTGRLGADGAIYSALEYRGVAALSVAERTTLASMAVEAGAKVGLVHPEGLPAEQAAPDWLLADDDHEPRGRRLEIDLDRLEPMLARPGRVDDVAPISEFEGRAVDVVYVGTCTNGRHEDIARVAGLLRGRRVAAGTRLIVVPASRASMAAAVADGSIATLLEAGAVIGPPGCGACIGRHMGVLAAGEVCLFTGNRNFRGRMGSPEAEIYLGSPEVAAATAVAGRLGDPRAILEVIC
ncbi:MAG: 3-isopropylmalate dehydratase large subunit [Planctomycetes bacterium]|nr:3-isopropylmalate dehydratase large subunit [Planctomycetota bacterium]